MIFVTSVVVNGNLIVEDYSDSPYSVELEDNVVIEVTVRNMMIGVRVTKRIDLLNEINNQIFKEAFLLNIDNQSK